MIDVGAALTRKIGPLPAVAWGAIIGGGVLVAKFLRGGSDGSGGAPVVIGGDPGIDLGGGGGGSSGGNGPPVVDDVTNVPATVTRYKLTLTGLTFLFSNPTKPHDAKGASGSYIVEPVTIAGKRFWKIISTASGTASSRVGFYIPRYSGTASTYTVKPISATSTG